MKYFRKTLGGALISYQPDPNEYGGEIDIPHAPGNQQYDDMIAEVEAGISTIEDKALDHVKTYADSRREAYGSIGDQLDMQYHDAVNSTTTWQDHVAAVKAANPKT